MKKELPNKRARLDVERKKEEIETYPDLLFWWLLNLDQTRGKAQHNSIAWLKLFVMQQLALVSRSWHQALNNAVNNEGDLAMRLFRWAHKTHKTLLLSTTRRHELPQLYQGNRGYSLNDEAWSNCCAVSLAMLRWYPMRTAVFKKIRRTGLIPHLMITYYPDFVITNWHCDGNPFWSPHGRCDHGWTKARLTLDRSFFFLQRSTSEPRMKYVHGRTLTRSQSMPELEHE